MFISCTKKAVCSLVLSLVLVQSVDAQISKVFGGQSEGQPAGGAHSSNQQRPSTGNPRQNPLPSTNHPIQGVWVEQYQTKDGNTQRVVFGFSADGEFVAVIATKSPDGEVETKEMNGLYRIEGENVILRFVDGTEIQLRYSVQGDRLQMTGPNQMNFDLQRYVKESDEMTAQQTPSKQVPQQQTPRNQSNPTVDHSGLLGEWRVDSSFNGNRVYGRLVINPDGTYHASVTVSNYQNQVPMVENGRWQVQGNTIVFDAQGEVTTIPYQMDAQRLALTYREYGYIMVLARNPQMSSIHPLGGYSQPPSYGQPPAHYQTGPGGYGQAPYGGGYGY